MPLSEIIQGNKLQFTPLDDGFTLFGRYLHKALLQSDAIRVNLLLDVL